MEYSSNWVLVALTAVIAFATALYAIITIMLARETRLLRKVQTDPLISLHFGAYSNFIIIEIQNVGQGPAYKIDFKILDNIEVYGNKHLTDLNILKGRSYLAPGQTISYELANYTELEGKSFRIIVQYENKYGESFDEEFTLDIGELEGSLLSSAKVENSLSSIATTLRYINDTFQQMTEIGWGKGGSRRSMSISVKKDDL